MAGDVFLDLFPIAFVIAEFFAPGAERQQAAESFHLGGELFGPAEGGKGIGAFAEEQGKQAKGYFLVGRHFLLEQAAEHADDVAGEGEGMENSPLGVFRGKGLKKNGGILAQSKGEPAVFDAMIDGLLQDVPFALFGNGLEFKVEISLIDEPEAGGMEEVQAGDVALADFEDAFVGFAIMKVTPEMFQGGKEGQEFAPGIQLV